MKVLLKIILCTLSGLFTPSIRFYRSFIQQTDTQPVALNDTSPFVLLSKFKWRSFCVVSSNIPIRVLTEQSFVEYLE